MRIFALSLLILSLTYCGHAHVRSKSNTLNVTNKVQDRYWYFLWGSAPSHTVDIRQKCGEGRTFTEVHYYYSASSYLITFFTIGIVMPVDLEITCAE
ncbi:Bor/Iss family lipoprotein [Leptospira barantonii]|uniref:Bor/Iss family lipoprotein n=1 Tax=Leptospira barantonii TaxID=2023184 RepID=UPI001AEFCA22